MREFLRIICCPTYFIIPSYLFSFLIQHISNLLLILGSSLKGTPSNIKHSLSVCRLNPILIQRWSAGKRYRIGLSANSCLLKLKLEQKRKTRLFPAYNLHYMMRWTFLNQRDNTYLPFRNQIPLSINFDINVTAVIHCDSNVCSAINLPVELVYSNMQCPTQKRCSFKKK